MRHISEVLRLAAKGLSQREIDTSLGISRTSVRNYLARAERAGLSWPLPEHLDDAAIKARLFKRTDEGVRSDRPEPDWLEVHREHKRGKHVTLQLLWLEYKRARIRTAGVSAVLRPLETLARRPGRRHAPGVRRRRAHVCRFRRGHGAGHRRRVRPHLAS